MPLLGTTVAMVYVTKFIIPNPDCPSSLHIDLVSQPVNCDLHMA